MKAAKRVAVIGGRGKTGRAVSDALAERGASTTPIGRAEMFDLPAILSECDAAYVIAPNMYPDEPRFVGDVLNVAVAAGVPRIVYHSVATPYAPAMPHHMGKVVSENLIRESGIPWTILQPGPYLQNFLPALRSSSPALDQPYDVTQPFNFVHLADVAQAAAITVLGDSHVGATYELGGPDRMSVSDVASVAAEVLGIAVPARRIEPSAWAANDGADLDPRVREWLLAMFDYYDKHGLPCGHVTLQAVLGQKPTHLKAALHVELRHPRNF